MKVDIRGAADLHCHFGPDAHRDRSVTALEAGRQAAQAGHAAVVLKSHDYPTPALASLVGEVVPEIHVYGGICCDREVGGVNPAAVETALLLGAKVVWLPTLSSHQDFQNGVASRLNIPGPGLSVVDQDGKLTDDAREVMDLVAAHSALLATGHISAEEHLAVARSSSGRLLVTHATEELAGPNLSVDQCLELADLGAMIELCAMTCIGALATRSPEQMAACARAVGFERCTLATDYGQAVNPRPAEGFQAFADALFDEGLGEADIRRMACENPCSLLGLH